MPPAMHSKVGVCLLTFNHVNVVASTIASILNQSLSQYDVLISDDCSTDGTWELLSQLAATDSRIRLFRTPRNSGMAGNANFAVAKMENEYVALLHHDDLYRKDLLQQWQDRLNACPAAGFVFNQYANAETHEIYETPRPRMPSGCINGEWLLRKHLLRRWGCVVRGTAMVRRQAWIDVGGMRTQYGLLADVDLWMRLARVGHVAYVPESLIAVGHARPSYYPDIYKGAHWSWERQRLLYAIHADNTRWLVSKKRASNLRWLGFRVRLSAETGKWLTYAIVRRKGDMLRACEESATVYDLAPLRWYRRFVLFLGKFFIRL